MRWRPYEQSDRTIGIDGLSDLERSVLQYCDSGSVAHPRTPDDPRLDLPTVMTDGLNVLSSAGRRVTGDGSVLEKLLEAFTQGRLTVEINNLWAPNARASELVIDLKPFSQALANDHRHIRP